MKLKKEVGVMIDPTIMDYHSVSEEDMLFNNELTYATVYLNANRDEHIAQTDKINYYMSNVCAETNNQR